MQKSWLTSIALIALCQLFIDGCDRSNKPEDSASQASLSQMSLADTYAQGVTDLAARNYEMAGNRFRAVLKAYPEHAESNIRLGQIAMQLGFYPDALNLYKKGLDRLEKRQITIDSTLSWQQLAAEAHYGMGMIMSKGAANLVDNDAATINKRHEQTQEAISHLKRAIQLNPKQDQAKKLLRQLAAS